MPELKQPQEAAEKTTEQPLTTKKKRAMLEYMAIMFAAAFLLVAVSLLIKVIDMKGEMEAANTGARENIALLQKDLDAARAESAELQTKLDEANAASSEAADKLSEAETRLSEAEKARETGLFAQLLILSHRTSAVNAVEHHALQPVADHQPGLSGHSPEFGGSQDIVRVLCPHGQLF